VAEVRQWPVFLGGVLHGRPIPDDDWRNAPIHRQRLSPRDRIPPAGSDLERWSEVKLEVVPAEVAVRFLCLGGDPTLALRAFAEAAFMGAEMLRTLRPAIVREAARAYAEKAEHAEWEASLYGG
jgi:hypothetical protein